MFANFGGWEVPERHVSWFSRDIPHGQLLPIYGEFHFHSGKTESIDPLRVILHNLPLPGKE